MTQKKPFTLNKWREIIEEQVPFVGIKSYSHNIIGVTLSAIAKGWGDEKANRTIKDFGLEALGWRIGG